MLKKIAARVAVLGVLGFAIITGGFAVAGANAPEAKANGCFGWSGVFIRVINCNGYGYPGGYPGGYPIYPPPPVYGPPPPIYTVGGPGGYPCGC